MTQHTKEPWHVYELNNVIYTRDENGEATSLARVYGGNEHANAQRITACVNACAGIPNSVLVVFTQPGCNILAANTLANEQINKYSEDIKAVTERCQQLERALVNKDAEIDMLRELSLNLQDELKDTNTQHADLISKLDEILKVVKPFHHCVL